MVETTNRQPKGFFRKSPVNFDFAGLTEELNSLYFSDMCCIPDLADGNETDVFTEAELEGFVTRVYEGAFKDESFDKSRVNKYAKVFSKAVIKGYSDGKKQSVKIDNDSPDAKMIEALKKNVFHFSVAKNKTEIKAMSEALLDANEKLRTFKDFTTEAKKIAEDFQGRYMKAEYDLAVNASTTAARWVEYDDEDILVYQTAGDSRVSPESFALFNSNMICLNCGVGTVCHIAVSNLKRIVSAIFVKYLSPISTSLPPAFVINVPRNMRLKYPALMSAIWANSLLLSLLPSIYSRVAATIFCFNSKFIILIF